MKQNEKKDVRNLLDISLFDSNREASASHSPDYCTKIGLLFAKCGNEALFKEAVQNFAGVLSGKLHCDLSDEINHIYTVCFHNNVYNFIYQDDTYMGKPCCHFQIRCNERKSQHWTMNNVVAEFSTGMSTCDYSKIKRYTDTMQLFFHNLEEQMTKSQ